MAVSLRPSLWQKVIAFAMVGAILMLVVGNWHQLAQYYKTPETKNVVGSSTLKGPQTTLLPSWVEGGPKALAEEFVKGSV